MTGAGGRPTPPVHEELARTSFDAKGLQVDIVATRVTLGEDVHLSIRAIHAGADIGRAAFFPTGDEAYSASGGDPSVFVDGEFRRRGIASAMYLLVGHELGYQLVQLDSLSDDGEAFWKALGDRWPKRENAIRLEIQ